MISIADSVKAAIQRLEKTLSDRIKFLEADNNELRDRFIEKDIELKELKSLLSTVNRRVIPGDTDTTDSLRKMYREWEDLKKENKSLWNLVDYALPSMKRDLARCGVFGGAEEKNRYTRWFSELVRLKERSRTHENSP